MIKEVKEGSYVCSTFDETSKVEERDIEIKDKFKALIEKDLVLIKNGDIFAKIENKEDSILTFFTMSVLGEKTAEKILNHYDYDLIKVLDVLFNDFKDLESISGIGTKKAESYHKKIVKLKKEDHTYLKYDYLFLFLLSLEGIYKHHITKLITRWKEEVLENLLKNPYEIVKTDGIGFRTADALAINLGWDLDSEERLEEGINFAFESIIFSGGIGEIKYPKGFNKKELSNLNSSGHTYLLKSDLHILCYSLLSKEDWDLPVEKLFELIEKMEEEEKLIYLGETNIDGNDISTYTIPSIYNMEKYVFEKLEENKEISNYKIKENIEEFIKGKEKELSCQFSDKQKDALRIANTNPTIMVIGGYAGTGKTTATKAILSIFDSSEIMGCALSGIAANKIRLSSGFPAKTIHSLIGISPKGTKYNENEKLPFDVIIVDESSMVDLITFYKLFKAIDFNRTKLILLGDPGQLPPVGCGDVFKNIIDFKIIDNQVVFDKVFRQSEDQVINIFAQEVRRGKVPSNYKLNFDDFKYVEHQPRNYWLTRKNMTESERKDWEKTHKVNILESIKNYTRYYKKDLFDLYESKKVFEFLSYFQILSPTKVGLLGTENINQEAQFILNPIINNKKYFISKKIFSLSKANISYRVRDKVIHLKNQNMKVIDKKSFKELWAMSSFNEIDSIASEERVFNGQIGVIIDMQEKRFFGKQENIIAVFYPSEDYIAFYREADFNKGSIALGYSISIHKSQGSEFENVLMPSTIAHYYLLNANLLYTAITRAKKKLIIAGEDRAFTSSCKKKEEIKRNTVIEVLKG